MGISFGIVGTATPVVPAFRKKGPSSKGGFYHTNLTRPFVAWDGEGYDDEKGAHHYFLFGNSDGLEVSAASLSSEQCFELMLRAEYENPDAIHIGFAFDYDVNMMLRDFSRLRLVDLKRTQYADFKGYRIHHIPKKWFQVTGTYKGKKITCRIQDVFSYYAMSFVKALKKNGIGTSEDLARIEAGKEQRGSFHLSMLNETVRPYWQAELRYLVQLADSLRDSLHAAGIKPTGWYGPGNVASAVFKREGVKDYMGKETPQEVLTAASYSYAGGRFEAFRVGYYDGPVYSADINSAYPHALRHMPDLATGTWEYSEDPDYLEKTLWDDSIRMALYYVESRIKWSPKLISFPFPKFHRTHGGVCWPLESNGWSHKHEMRLVSHSKSGHPTRGWIYHDDGKSPFTWVGDMFEERKRMQREGNPAEKALKLCLNSCYGKFAQRVGWDETNRKAPTWHQLLWAGSITSYARAQLFMGAIPTARTSGLVAVETDGIYSTTPFHGLPESDSLGDWKIEEYTGILYLQSGVYWLRDRNGDWLPPKSRGIPQKHLNIDDAMKALKDKQPLRAEQTRFQGYGQAVHLGKLDGWRRWSREPKEFVLGGNGKRIHNKMFCGPCKEGAGWHEGLHEMREYKPKDRDSEKHDIPWEREQDETAPELTEWSRHEERWNVDVV